MRTINDLALALIKRNEGLRLSAYRDIAGIWTIGYGHTPAHAGQVVTEQQASDLLRADLASAEAAVDGATHDVATTDSQFSAMVSLAFNIGNAAFRGSSVLKMHRARNYAGAGNAFLSWSKAHVNGALVVVPGLLRRRNEERTLYLAGASAQPAPAPAGKPAVVPESDADALNRAELARVGAKPA